METDETLFNPYRQVCPIHDKGDAPRIRRENLATLLHVHAQRNTRTLMVFEAPSYAGARRTGAPFVNEGMFREIEHILGVHTEFEKATKTPSQSALTTRIVWNTLAVLGPVPLILETVPFHPHEPTNPMSNRKPTLHEILIFGNHLERIIEIFDIDQIIAVGRTAERGLRNLGIECKHVRHPAQGGVRIFRQGLEYHLRKDERPVVRE